MPECPDNHAPPVPFSLFAAVVGAGPADPVAGPPRGPVLLRADGPPAAPARAHLAGSVRVHRLLRRRRQRRRRRAGDPARLMTSQSLEHLIQLAIQAGERDDEVG